MTLNEHMFYAIYGVCHAEYLREKFNLIAFYTWQMSNSFRWFKVNVYLSPTDYRYDVWWGVCIIMELIRGEVTFFVISATLIQISLVFAMLIPIAFNSLN